jgi:hypothetical protein
MPTAGVCVLVLVRVQARDPPIMTDSFDELVESRLLKVRPRRTDAASPRAGRPRREEPLCLTWRLLRDEPDFSPFEFAERFTSALSEDGKAISSAWEIRRDGEIWELVGLTYTK